MARRNKNEPPRAVAAAAERISLSDQKGNRKREARAADWQREAWQYFDEVPEVKQTTWLLGNMLAKLKLFVAVMPEDGDEPIPVTAEESPIPTDVAEQAVAELARLRSKFGGQREVIRELTMNLEVAGEAYIVGAEAIEATDEAEATPEDWDVKSVAEVTVRDGKWRILQSEKDSTGRELDEDRESVVHIWQRHPKWSMKADCAMRGVLDECKALYALSKLVIAETNSRMSAGIFTIPNELDVGPIKPSEPGEETPFVDEMDSALSDPIDDPEALAAVRPMLVTGPSEFLGPDMLRHITFARDQVTDLDERISNRVRRLARGLNLPVELVEGHMETTFANAAQVDQDVFDDHLEPRCVLICDGLTQGFLHPNLHETGVDPDVYGQVFIWYDASALVRRPDVEANAPGALRDGILSEEAARKHQGYSEDEAPSVEERLARAVLRRATFTPELVAALLGPMVEAADTEISIPEDVGELPEGDPDPDPADTDDDGDASAAVTAAVTVTSGSRIGADLAAIDRDTRTRLMTATESALNRALEKAGNRIISKAPVAKKLVRNIDAHLVAAQLGESIVSNAGLNTEDLLDGAFNSLEDDWVRFTIAAREQALRLLGALQNTSPGQLAALETRLIGFAGDGWAWYANELKQIAARTLYNPAAAATVGEFAAGTKVPPGYIRRALAVAGGEVEFLASVGDGAWLSLDPAGAPKPLGGIATGKGVLGATEGIEAWKWVYGPGLRENPFWPHWDRDQMVFSSWVEDSLAPGAFGRDLQDKGKNAGRPMLDVSHYMPGDHPHCQCDFEPIIVTE